MSVPFSVSDLPSRPVAARSDVAAAERRRSGSAAAVIAARPVVQKTLLLMSVSPARALSVLPLRSRRQGRGAACGTLARPRDLARCFDGSAVTPTGRPAARRGAGAARIIRNAAVHLLELRDPAPGTRRAGCDFGARDDSRSFLGRVRRHAAAAAALWLADLALAALGVPAVGLYLLRRQSGRLLGVVSPAGRSHLDRAQLLRLGERIQPVHPGSLLGPDGGRLHPRAVRTAIRLHLGRGELRRGDRPVYRQDSRGAARLGQPAAALGRPVAHRADIHASGHPLASAAPRTIAAGGRRGG